MLKTYFLLATFLISSINFAFAHGVERGTPELTASMSRFLIDSLASRCQITNDDNIEIVSIGLHMEEDGPGVVNLKYVITLKINSFSDEGVPTGSRQVVIEATEFTFNQGSESINLKSITSDESNFCGSVK